MKYIIRIIIITISVIFFKVNAQVATDNFQPPKHTAISSTETVAAKKDSLLSNVARGVNAPIQGQVVGQTNWQQYILSIIVLFFGMIIVLVLMFLYFKTPGFTSDHAIRIISITLIITGLLFIVSLSTTLSASTLSSLHAPAFGLLGTMAGYLLAKTARDNISSIENDLNAPKKK